MPDLSLGEVDVASSRIFSVILIWSTTPLAIKWSELGVGFSFAVLARGEPCSVHFYFASFEGLRQSLFPGLVRAYANWRESGNGAELLAVVNTGCTHWQNAAQRMLAVWRDNPDNAEGIIGSRDENFSELVL